MIFCVTSLHTVSDNPVIEGKKVAVNQTRTISADFGWQKNVQQLGYEEAVQFRFRSNGTIQRHYWNYDSSLNKKSGTDKYDNGTYVIMDSSSKYTTKITITWSNGRQQKCYIDYNYNPAKLSFDGMSYEELR